MKTNFIYSLLIGSTLLFSCEGPEGPQGPAGTPGKDGIAGKDGATGAQGQQGAAGQNATNNVKSTGWFKPDFTDADVTNNNTSKDAAGNIYQSYVYMNAKNKTQPLITQDVIDNGVVLVYFKSKTLVYNQSESGYELEERIWGGVTGSSASNYFKITGRELSKWEDFAYINYGVTNLNVNQWNIYASLSTPNTQVWQNGAYVYTSNSPELLNKSNAFYRELFAANVPEIRLVTMTASAAGRLKSLNYSNYEEVKKALELQD